jgi:hypothetical protein
MMRDVPLLPAVQKKRIRRSCPFSLAIGGTGQGVRLGSFPSFRSEIRCRIPGPIFGLTARHFHHSSHDRKLSYSENSPGAGTNGPTLGTIAEKSAHKGVGGPKRRHAVTALQPLDLRVAPE